MPSPTDNRSLGEILGEALRREPGRGEFLIHGDNGSTPFHSGGVVSSTVPPVGVTATEAAPGEPVSITLNVNTNSIFEQINELIARGGALNMPRYQRDFIQSMDRVTERLEIRDESVMASAETFAIMDEVARGVERSRSRGRDRPIPDGKYAAEVGPNWQPNKWEA